MKNIKATQPPIIDSITLSPGVTIRDGKVTKSSPNKLPTMSRRQYNNFKKSRSPSVTTIKSLVSEKPKRNTFDDIPEYDYLPEISERAPSKVRVKSLFSRNKVTTSSDYMEGTHRGTPVDVFNVAIIQNKAWGLNPATKEPPTLANMPKKARNRYAHRSNKVLWEAPTSFLKKMRGRTFTKL